MSRTSEVMLSFILFVVYLHFVEAFAPSSKYFWTKQTRSSVKYSRSYPHIFVSANGLPRLYATERQNSNNLDNSVGDQEGSRPEKDINLNYFFSNFADESSATVPNIQKSNDSESSSQQGPTSPNVDNDNVTNQRTPTTSFEKNKSGNPKKPNVLETTEPLSELDARVLQSILNEDNLDLTTEENMKKLLERGIKKETKQTSPPNYDDTDSEFSSTVLKVSNYIDVHSNLFLYIYLTFCYHNNCCQLINADHN